MTPSAAPTNTARGFSLIELAISLAIIAIIMAIGFASLRTTSQQSSLRSTREKMAEINSAMQAFAQVNRRLPCPDVSPDADADGIGDDGEEDACTSTRGGVPWKTLGLENAQDGWDRPIHYLATAAFLSSDFKLSSPGNIAISDGSNTLNTPSSVAFALWSEGPDRSNASSAETGNRILSGNSPLNDDLITWSSRFTLTGKVLDAGNQLPP